MVAKTNYSTKVREIEGKINSYVTTTVINTLLVNYVADTKFDAELKKISDRVTSNKTKDLLLENEINKLEKFNAAYFRGKNYFVGFDGTQNYLVFQPMYKYFRFNKGGKSIYSWESKGLSYQKLVLLPHPTIVKLQVCYMTMI